jgi:cob(I)alamin adenosyltransferase
LRAPSCAGPSATCSPFAAEQVEVSSSHTVAYLNRLSDLVWTLARWQEGSSRLTRSVDLP